MYRLDFLAARKDIIEYRKEIIEYKKENERLRTALNSSEETRKKAIEFIKENAGYDEEIRSCCSDLLYSDCDKLIELLGGDE